MRLLVVGAGSTGGYFGGRLAAAGRDVTFLVRPRRAEKLRAEGLQIVSPHGDLTISPQTVTAESIAGSYDAILLGVKAYSLEAAMADFAPAVGPATIIVPVLNGMRHVAALQSRFGADAVVGGLCRIAATIDERERIMHLAPMHALAYGEFGGASSDRMRAFDQFVQEAGFDAGLSPAIEREMWEKWLFLAALGAITCLMRGTIGETRATPGGLAVANALIDEIAAIVRAVGVPPGETFLATVRAQLTSEGSPLTSSMYRDLQKGGQTEADQILGDLLARADGAGISAPLLEAAYATLSIHQGRLGAA